MVLVIGGTGEAPPAVRLWAHVGPLACMCSDVDLADVGGGERAATAHKGALEGTFTYSDSNMDKSCHKAVPGTRPGHLYPFPPPQDYSSETLEQMQLLPHFL